ncbi:MAG TPA: PDZ domain-containing protein [Bryobacteraceae bacterium]|nr:PDZ domain-containing protein [Bryobacteraceae bacterium]
MQRITCAIVLGFGSLAMAQQPMLPSTTPPPSSRHLGSSGAYLGVMVQEIDSERARALKLPEEAGVEVTRITPDSPADKAGLKSGDAILRYNGEHVEGMTQFSRLISETPPGREVHLDVYRNGAPQTITVKAGTRPEPNGLVVGTPPMPTPHLYEFTMPDMPRSFMTWSNSMVGMTVETLEGQLAQFFGVKEGVLVRSVNSGSAAERAGLKAGDVITRVDDSHIATPADVSNRVRESRGKPVTVVVMRDHKEMTLSLTVDDRHAWFENHYFNGDRQYFNDDWRDLSDRFFGVTPRVLN